MAAHGRGRQRTAGAAEQLSAARAERPAIEVVDTQGVILRPTFCHTSGVSVHLRRLPDRLRRGENRIGFIWVEPGSSSRPPGFGTGGKRSMGTWWRPGALDRRVAIARRKTGVLRRPTAPRDDVSI